MIGQSLSGTPGHINAMASSMRHFLAAYPPEKLAPGDVLVTNDPWMTAGQINDITITTPIFKNGRLVAWFANTCHPADIGGGPPSPPAPRGFRGRGPPPRPEALRAGRAHRNFL